MRFLLCKNVMQLNPIIFFHYYCFLISLFFFFAETSPYNSQDNILRLLQLFLWFYYFQYLTQNIIYFNILLYFYQFSNNQPIAVASFTMKKFSWPLWSPPHHDNIFSEYMYSGLAGFSAALQTRPIRSQNHTLVCLQFSLLSTRINSVLEIGLSN